MSGAAPITNAAELLSELWAPLVLKFFKKQKIKNALFIILKKFNIIDPHMNTTKLVIMTLPNYHEKEFKIY